MEFLLIIVVLVVVAIGAVFSLSQEQEFLEAAAGERAFDERIQVMPFDFGQLLRLKPLVEEVGVVRVPAPIDDRRRSVETGRYYNIGDTYQVFVLDTLGEIHDVHIADREEDAMLLARELSEKLDAKLME